MVNLSKLNPNQVKAVKSVDESVLVIAGAGTGKTTVLTSRIAYLVDEIGASPSRILAVTFTNKASDEMNKRIAQMLNGQFVPWMGTYHGMCLKILKYDIEKLKRKWNKNFVIIDEDDKSSMVKAIVKENQIKLENITTKKIVSLLSVMKSVDFLENDFSESEQMDLFGVSDPVVCKNICYIYRQYNLWLERDNSLDFDDLINFTFDLFHTNPDVATKWRNMFDYVMIDEFQDTNYKQFQIIKYLVNERNNIFVVGDPNQSIYGWRGSYQKIFDDYCKQFNVKNIINLSENYRSTNKILNVANDLIKHNNERFQNDLNAHNANNYDVDVYFADYMDDEANFVANRIKSITKDGAKSLNDITILYRANYVTRSIEQSLISRDIPYLIYGAIRFYERREIKDLISYLKVIYAPDDISYLQIINVPKRAIGEETISQVLQWSKRQKKSFIEAINDIDQCDEISEATKNKIHKFNSTVKYLVEQSQSAEFTKMITVIMDTVNYSAHLETFSIDIAARMENIDELKKSIDDFINNDMEATPLDFINKISLYTAAESMKELNMPCVKLMTVHMAKGLEFDTVFLYNFSEGTFPSPKAIMSTDGIEEERRIAYVAITRAINKLYITTTKEYTSHYSQSRCAPSRFLLQINKNLYNTLDKRTSSVSNKDIEWFDSRTSSFGQKKLNLKTIYTNDYKFNVGDIVIHTIFGSGVICAINDSMLDIVFKAPHGKKTIVASHNSIKRVVS